MQNSTVIGKLGNYWATYMVKNNAPYWLDDAGKCRAMAVLENTEMRKIIAVIPEWV